MQDTVDQAHGALPGDQHHRGRAPGRSLRCLISEADMAAVLAAAGKVFTGATGRDGVRDGEVTLRVDEIVFRIHGWTVLARTSRQR